MPSRREVYLMENKPTFGPTRLDESKFPTFRDGDVKIIITGSRQYQLHKSILTNSSPMFQQLLSDENTATLSKKAKKKGVVVTNLLRLVNFAPEGEEKNLAFKVIKLDDEGRSVSNERIGLDLENGMMVDPVYMAFGKVLGAFYHIPINLGDFGEATLADVITPAVDILKVAEYLGCVPIITQHFEATLLAMGQVVHRSISQNPCLWLNLSIRMRSKPLYRESMIHAAGQYYTEGVKDAYPSFDPLTRTLIDNMASLTRAAVQSAESKMASYYPTSLQRAKSVGLVDKEINSRNSYANDILEWMALTIFRQWLNHQSVGNHTHNSPDLGCEFLRTVRAMTYLKHEDLQAWHQFFPMSARGKHVIETQLLEIKKHVSNWAQIAVQNVSKLQGGNPRFFTFIPFEGDKYPWEVEVKQRREEEDEDEDEDENDADDEGSDTESKLREKLEAQIEQELAKKGISREQHVKDLEAVGLVYDGGSLVPRRVLEKLEAKHALEDKQARAARKKQFEENRERVALDKLEYGDSDFEAELMRMDPEQKKRAEGGEVDGEAAKKKVKSEGESEEMGISTRTAMEIE